jgi:hypothetical protein
VPKIYDGEKTASSTNVAGKSGYPSARILKSFVPRLAAFL